MDYIDIHTHILYGTDDGAKSYAETEKLIDIAFAHGTRTVFLTPHSVGKGFDINAVNERLLSLKPIRDKHPDLKLYSGAEVMYVDGVTELLRKGLVPTLANSDYVLIEFFHDTAFGAMAIAVQDLLTDGYKPIIAHAERYAQLTPERVETLVTAGALIQVNSASVTGGAMSDEARLCKKLLKRHLVHFVASDCHDTASRGPALNRCAKRVIKKYGKDYAEEIFFKNALSVIQNRAIWGA